jgi:hypothetical protein
MMRRWTSRSRRTRTRSCFAGGSSWSAVVALATGSVLVLVVALLAEAPAARDWGVPLGVFGAIVSVALFSDRMRTDAARQLVIDREGFVVDGRHVPWEAVMSMLWVQAHSEAGDEHIEVRVHSIAGFEAPRQRRVLVFHKAFDLSANTLIDLFEAAALPRRISVLAIEPPSMRGR